MDDAETVPAVTASCTAEGGTGAVRAPRLVRQIATGETGWFSSPGLVDLDGDGRLEIVAPFYSTFVFDASGHLLGRGRASEGRVYAAVGGHRSRGRRHRRHRGRRRLGHGRGVRVPRRPAAPQGRVAGVHQERRPVPGGPRARRRGPRRRRPRRGRGDDDQHLSHRCAGLRVRRERRAVPARRAVTLRPGRATTGSPGRATTCGSTRSATTATARTARTSRIGNIDDDADLEIITTFDNHQINAFNLDGTSILASPWFTNRESGADGQRMGWGQFIRWADPRVERRHYHLHTGRGRARPARPGCSGPRRRPRWPTWTVTAATR